MLPGCCGHLRKHFNTCTVTRAHKHNTHTHIRTHARARPQVDLLIFGSTEVYEEATHLHVHTDGKVNLEQVAPGATKLALSSSRPFTVKRNLVALNLGCDLPTNWCQGGNFIFDPFYRLTRSYQDT